MSEEASRHNALTREFVLKITRQTENVSELMVILESTIFATMLIAQRAYGHSPAVAAGLVEAAVHRATERFTAEVGNGGDNGNG